MKRAVGGVQVGLTRLGTRVAHGRQRQRKLATHASQGGQGTNRGLNLLEWAGAGGLVPQGLLVKGAKAAWRTTWETFMRELAPQGKDGSYKRPSYTFTSQIGGAGFPAEPGRYHLYVGNPCPWCHRVLLALALRGLSQGISFTRAIDDPERASRGGWVFDSPGDPVFGCRDLREVYELLSPGYRGRCTAPLLVDKKTRRIVCNESALILRNLNSVVLPGSSSVDLCPPQLQPQVDAWNERIYESVNNGVYKSGFATSQAAFDAAQRELYATLDAVEEQLSRTRFVCGDRFTEADLRLFPTIIRFDAVYAILFKCSKQRVADYPHLSAWMRDVQQLQLLGSGLQVQDCFDFEDARRSYFMQLFPLNPGGIVPAGPTAEDLGLGRPAGRGSQRPEDVFFAAASSPVVAT